MLKWKRRGDEWNTKFGKYYAKIRLRKHYKKEGFDSFWQHYTVLIGRGGEWLWGEGIFGTSLRNLKAAKSWAKNKLIEKSLFQ